MKILSFSCSLLFSLLLSLSPVSGMKGPVKVFETELKCPKISKRACICLAITAAAVAIFTGILPFHDPKIPACPFLVDAGLDEETNNLFTKITSGSATHHDINNFWYIIREYNSKESLRRMFVELRTRIELGTANDAETFSCKLLVSKFPWLEDEIPEEDEDAEEIGEGDDEDEDDDKEEYSLENAEEEPEFSPEKLAQEFTDKVTIARDRSDAYSEQCSSGNTCTKAQMVRTFMRQLQSTLFQNDALREIPVQK